MKSPEMGKQFHTQLKGETITVTVVEIEQDINSRHRGKWRCRNEATGRTLHRTMRQLRPLPAETPAPVDSYQRPSDHDQRLAQARRRARWELGDPSWAEVIIGAYMHPNADRVALEREEAA